MAVLRQQFLADGGQAGVETGCSTHHLSNGQRVFVPDAGGPITAKGRIGDFYACMMIDNGRMMSVSGRRNGAGRR